MTIDTRRGWRKDGLADYPVTLRYADGRPAAEVYAVEIPGGFLARYFRWRAWRPDGGEVDMWARPDASPGFGTASDAQAAAEAFLRNVGAEFPAPERRAVTIPAADEDVTP